MDIPSLIGSIIGGAIGGSALAKFVMDAAKERWMESVKAQSAAELEKLKDELTGGQKALQARLDHGTHVTQAQYDLELNSYKDLWSAMSDLREQWRSYALIASFQMQDPTNPELLSDLQKVGTAVVAANDAAVMVTGKLAPFYEKTIQTAAQTTTFESTTLIVKVGEWTKGLCTPEQGEAENRLRTIVEGVEKIDGLIRERLTSLRLV